MNSDTSLAAWMIAGGPRTIDPGDARNMAHVRELAASRTAPDARWMSVRLAAAVAAIRAPRTAPEPVCCPA
jgi:hypothetical protein